MNTVCPRGCNIPRAGARINNDFSQQEKKLFDDIAREQQRDDTKSHRGLLTTCDVLATNSDRARTGHNKSSSGKPATKSDRDWMEKCVGGSAPHFQSTPKTPEHTKLQPQKKREGHNLRESLQFTNSLSRHESNQEKSQPSQIPEGGLMQRIKDRRLKILQHLQRSQEGGVTDLADASTRQVVKHRGSRNFRQHRAEDCRNHRPIPQNCGYRQIIRCPKPEENIRKIGKRRPIDGMAFRGTPPPINGPFSVVPHTRRRAPNQSRLFSHMPGETA